jgi:hypothetical protein
MRLATVVFISEYLCPVAEHISGSTIIAPSSSFDYIFSEVL